MAGRERASHLGAGLAASRAMVLASDGPLEFRPGTVRGTAGFFRVGQAADGHWWLLDPEGRPFFLRAVNGVEAMAEEPDPVARLRAWGCNALGAGASETLREDGLPFVVAVDFCAAGAAIRAEGVRLPDVFDPGWPQAAARRAAEVCPAWAGRAELVGWLTDAELGWARPGGGRPSLLQVCLSLEPSLAAWHAAWEFALAPHGGRIEALGRAWGVPLGNKEVVRELTREGRALATRGYLRDEARWAAEFARRYHAVAVVAVREQDKRHLVMAANGGADIFWSPSGEVPAGAAGPAVAGGFSWVSEAFWGEAGARGRGLTAVERMLRRGRLALQRLAAQPAAVGYAWSQWRDRAGERPPFAGGLVHADGAEAREHTDLLAVCNARVHEWRRSANVSPV